MDKQPLISVIVPVYNAGIYLTPCIESILKQTYTNLEILLINDGSKDNSGKICDEYAARDSRIKVTHKENGGVSSARNLGLANATGEYIAFVDSDDRIEPDYFETLYSDAEKNNADIVCCNCIEVDADDKPLDGTFIRVINNRLITGKETVLSDNINKKELYFSSSCASLIRACLAKKHSFRTYRFAEDYMYMFELFSTNPTVYLDSYVGYHYVRWGGSVSAEAYNFKRAYDHLQIDSYCFGLLQDVSQEINNEFYLRFASQLHDTAYSTAKKEDKPNRKEHRKMLKEFTEKIVPVRKCLPRSLYLYLTLLTKAPRLYYLATGFNEWIHNVRGIK